MSLSSLSLSILWWFHFQWCVSSSSDAHEGYNWYSTYRMREYFHTSELVFSSQLALFATIPIMFAGGGLSRSLLHMVRLAARSCLATCHLTCVFNQFCQSMMKYYGLWVWHLLRWYEMAKPVVCTGCPMLGAGKREWQYSINCCCCSASGSASNSASADCRADYQSLMPVGLSPSNSDLFADASLWL